MKTIAGALVVLSGAVYGLVASSTAHDGRYSFFAGVAIAHFIAGLYIILTAKDKPSP